MLKQIIICSVFLLCTLVHAQKNDTLYTKLIDDFQLVSPEKANFYKVIRPMDKQGFSAVEDYTIEGYIVSKGFARRDMLRFIYKGERFFYGHDGEVTGVYKYDDKGNQYSIESFDSLKKKSYRLITKEGKPFAGEIYDLGVLYTYEKGKQIKVTCYYNNSTQPYAIKKVDTIQYFDIKGDVVGELNYATDNGEFVPLNGDKYEYKQGRFVSYLKYQDRAIVYQGKFNLEAKAVFQLQHEVFYKNEKYYKENVYYTDGKLRVTNWYSQDNLNVLISSDYYNQNEQYLGTYNEQTKTGVNVYFYDDFFIKQIKTEKEGRVLKEINFLKETEPVVKTRIYYKLSEIDYAQGQGWFYDQKGELISSVEYKDGIPWSGTTYEFSDGNVVISPYVNGFIDGIQEIYADYPNTPLILRKNVYKDKKLRLEQWYEQGELLQELEYASANEANAIDELISKGKKYIVYRDGQPYHGSETTEELSHIREDIYRKGKKIETTYTAHNGLVFAKEFFFADSKIRRIFYNDQGREIISYEVQFERLNGDYSYTDKNGITYKATFQKGYLISGEVLYNYINEDDQHNLYYIYVKRLGSKVDIKLKDVSENKWLNEQTISTEDIVYPNISLLAAPIDAQFLYFDSEYRFLFTD